MVWRFVDGKPGHENQSAGLLQALRERVMLEVFDLPVDGRGAWWHWLRARFPAGDALPAPDYLLGAGHATHVPMLAARRAHGGRAVVLMKPSLPCRWFDLCVIPRHDASDAAGNVLVTDGVLNRMRPGGYKDTRQGLVLVGGPSKHHGWDGAALLADIKVLLETDVTHRWTLTTSRRTPADWLPLLAPLVEKFGERLQVMPGERTGPDWLARQLTQASVAWVTEDSVSMVYEALTAGALVGVLPMPVRREGRVVQGVEKLIVEKRVIDFASWRQHMCYPEQQAFNEAQRGADWMCERWMS